MFEVRVKTSQRVESRNITDEVLNVVRGKMGRILHVFTPHTTCSIVINEDSDPHVMEESWRRLIDWCPGIIRISI